MCKLRQHEAVQFPGSGVIRGFFFSAANLGAIVDFIQWEILLYEELGFLFIAILEVYASNFKFLPDTIGILGFWWSIRSIYS